ncbi:MAG TPA: LD-carboxypeptidase [Chitinophagaceae bacterium]|nr:LD-carboxypeptidase [Chitinophagaceae bacterium]
MHIILPPYLTPGDTIGIICPSGYMPAEKVQASVRVFQQWGFNVARGKTIGHQFHYFSGTDEERLNDLQQMMDNDDVKAIFCARGGYGMGRIIDAVKFKKFKKQPKWIIGYSDITVLQTHLFSKYNIASLHAPMAAAFIDHDAADPYIQSLYDSLTGKKTNYIVQPHGFNRSGKVSGTLIGGNLSLLAHLTGTSSEIQTKNAILFIEDVGEYIYNIDRMMYQLKRSGKLKKLKGLIVGKFSDSKDTTIPFGETASEVIRDIVKEYEYPVCFDFPVSHEKENYALKVGGEYELAISADKVVLKEG